ncbi:AraC family ligand binding domain-containing protein [Bradyrhizobium diazoefficiens]|uniref:AraC family ligand binding domain-containing protein n=1 Tax=Bradyrhizobium diazoefficiens TaxID=1355477 RepID=UPI003F7BD521
MSLLRADFRHHDYGSHTHDAYVIAVTESGGAEIRNRNVVRKVGAATLFVSNPDERQSARMGDSGRWRYRAFYLAQPAIGDLARRFGTNTLPHLQESMLDDGDLIGRFDRLHRVLETEQDDLLADELVADAFGRLFERYGDGRRSKIPAGRDAVVSRLIALMRERHAENLSLDQLAGLAGPHQFPADRAVQAHGWPHPARLSRPHQAQRGLPFLEAWPFAGRQRAGGGILRPGRAQQAFQALLRHHALAVCAGRASGLTPQFQPILPGNTRPTAMLRRFCAAGAVPIPGLTEKAK